MAYEKTVWQTGDIVTSEKLNKIEQGIADAGPMIVHVTIGVDESENHTYTLDKTFTELKTAFDAGTDVKILYPDEMDGVTVLRSYRMTEYYYVEDVGESFYAISFEGSRGTDWNDNNPFMANSFDGYPVCTESK